MPLTDEEIGALYHAGKIAEWHAAIAAQAAESAQLPPDAPAGVSEAKLMIMFRRFALNLAGVTVQQAGRETALLKRVAELEQRLAALESAAPDASLSTRLSTVEVRTGALSMIAAKGQAADRLPELEAMIRRVDELWARPSR